MKNPINCFVTFLLIVSSGCSALPDFAPAPERLQLINGELEACLLVSTDEVESISGVQVASEQGYEYSKEKALIVRGPTSCRYLKDNGEVIMLTSADTEVSLLRQGYNSYVASVHFQRMKMVDIDMAERVPAIFKLQDIDDLGEQAYSRIGDRIDINFLKNEIVYWFSTRPIADGGMGYDALFKLALIALQRAP